MIFLQFWWTLMLLSGTNMLQAADSGQPSSEQLSSFNRAVLEARDKMQNLGGADSLYRPPRHTIDDMLASFVHTSDEVAEEPGLAEAADAWYRDFQAASQKKARAVRQQKSQAKTYVSKYDKQLQDTEIGKVKLKYKDPEADLVMPQLEATSAPFLFDGGGLSSLDIKLKHAQQILNEHEQTSKKDPPKLKEYHKKTDVSDEQPEFGDAPVPEGIYEQKISQLDAPKVRPNNLLHEANYKLSKIEQEASENTQRPPRPKGSDLMKRSFHLGFNPMNEIKLKTSSRLMLKGMGPSLPSNALMESQHARHVEEVMKRRQLKMQREQQRQDLDPDVDLDMDQEQNREIDSSDDAELGPQNDGFSPSLSNDVMQVPEVASSGDHQTMDLPESYDYHLPPYDRFHALSQRQMPDMVRVRSSRRSTGDLVRYKREHAPKQSLEMAVKEPGNKVKLEVAEPQHGVIPEVKTNLEKEAIEGKDMGTTADSGKAQVEAAVKLSAPVKVDTDFELKPTESAMMKDSSVLEADPLTKPEVADVAQDPAVVVDSPEAKPSAEADANSLAVPQLELEQPQVQEKAQPAASMEDSGLQENVKLSVEESVTSMPAEVVPKTESVEAAAAAGTAAPRLVDADAVVKLLAREMSHQRAQTERKKRHIHRRRRHERMPYRKRRRSRRSTGDEQQPTECHKRAKRMAAPLLDDFEDHNGNRLRFGDLGNGLLMPDAKEEEEELEEEPHYDEDEASLYDGSNIQVPMMNQRANGGGYQVTQQPLQMQQQQQQQQPQQQQPQQQPPQQLQIHNQPSFKATFNLTNFFNELQKIQKNRPSQQQQYRPALQQQQQQQQQQQRQQQQPSPSQRTYLPQKQYPPQKQNQYLPQKQYAPKQQYLPQKQHTPLHTQLKQPQMKVQAPPLMKQSAVHRYFGPFFNKQVKSNVLSTVDPCITPGPAPTQSTLPITVDPNCVSITTRLPDASTESTTTGIGESSTEIPSMANTTDAAGNGTTSEGAADQESTTSGPAVPADDFCSSPDAMKLNVSINANVCGDPKTKQFYGNGSINMRPAFDQMDNDDLMLDWPHAAEHENNDYLMEHEDRYAREAATEDNDMEKSSHRRYNRWGKLHAKGKSSKCSNTEHCDDSLEKLISGKTSEAIVSAVLEAVSNDPGMDRLLAVLERNRKGCQKKPKNFYQIRNDKNDQYLQHTESMVRDTMEAISDIIDKQVRLRACIPLRPDLSEFYDLILKTMEEQKKSREKRENSVSGLAHDFSEDVRLLDVGQIDSRSRIVKKLLRQYEQLPLEEQRAAANIRDELLTDLMYLRKMADSVERTQREAKLQQVLRHTNMDNVLQSQSSSELSPRFIKLVKTAELFKEAGEQQARAFVGL
ncbi:uncharacterized protein LOC117591848 [Drosophila guanche]|uniref:uncharacterized protein LOC117591848 n=1 Tax=Drosophila guanche TaxID=7266 RepID=UPI0014713B97|nr:uncharacterized protein LOC117591848 [Drosophila guanche]